MNDMEREALRDWLDNRELYGGPSLDEVELDEGDWLDEPAVYLYNPDTDLF